MPQIYPKATTAGEAAAQSSPKFPEIEELVLDERARRAVELALLVAAVDRLGEARVAALNGDHARAAALLAALAAAQPNQVDLARKALTEAIGSGQMATPSLA